MMSKKKWIALFIIFLIYLFLGAGFFYTVENREEEIRRNQSRAERNQIRELLTHHYDSSENHTLEDMLARLSEYSGKEMVSESDEEYDTPQKWDFYHSLFFSITVVTTIGYGNIAPTVSLSRIVMIFYAIVGLPMNGILYATLGQYFGKTFIKLYRRWKNNKVKDYAARLGLVSRICLYLVPGFTIFIFIPAIIMMYMEGWVYDLAVYYCFVTLTTIGFGDFVAGFNNQGFGPYFIVYQIFLIVWIIFGLGYLVMVLGFLTGGLRSKRIKKLQKNLTSNFKNTHSKLWNGFVKDLSYFRRIMNELYMAKFKPVYHDDMYTATSTPNMCSGSQSFPDLRVLYNDGVASPGVPRGRRRRANSECITSAGGVAAPTVMSRIQSDSDLKRIDRDATFAAHPIQPGELLQRVVHVLGTTMPDDPDTSDEEDGGAEMEGGIHGFSDEAILASERFGSGWSLGGSNTTIMMPPKVRRPRAASEIKMPSVARPRHDDASVEWTWSGPAASKQIKELRERFKKNNESNGRRNTVDANGTLHKTTFINRIKHSFIKSAEEKRPDVERPEAKAPDSKRAFAGDEEMYLRRTRQGRESVFSVPEARVLEEMTVGDLLRTLRSIHSRQDLATPNDGTIGESRRKMGTAGLTPPQLPSLLDLFNAPANVQQKAGSRRGSVVPPPAMKKRFSLRPVREAKPGGLPSGLLLGGERRASLHPDLEVTTAAPLVVNKQLAKLRSSQLNRRSRHDSLRDVTIDEL